MKRAVERKDYDAFNAQFKILTVSRNLCHAMETMPFVRIQSPEHRPSPVRFKP
jgi:hypothetical protein